MLSPSASSSVSTIREQLLLAFAMRPISRSLFVKLALSVLRPVAAGAEGRCESTGNGNIKLSNFDVRGDDGIASAVVFTDVRQLVRCCRDMATRPISCNRSVVPEPCLSVCRGKESRRAIRGEAGDTGDAVLGENSQFGDEASGEWEWERV